MKHISSVLLVAAAMLGSARGMENGAASPQTPEGSAKTANCLAEFNAARERADLDPFTTETDTQKKMPISDKEYIKAICEAIKKESYPYFASCFLLLFVSIGETVKTAKVSYQRTGTYAYAPHSDPLDGCSAAVTYWKGAHVNFGELPPVYEGEKGVYKESRNRSLVALYNPKKDATIDCAYITCPITSTTTTTASTSETTTEESTTVSGGPAGLSVTHEADAAPSASVEGQGNDAASAPFAYPASYGEGSQSHQHGGPSVRRLADAAETVTSLVCLTNPAALVDKEKPFSEDVWEEIKDAIENSASASTPHHLHDHHNRLYQRNDYRRIYNCGSCGSFPPRPPQPPLPAKRLQKNLQL
ncbi:SAG family member [Eimeria mitis]|uniref:SAG family member n=1 Tax=Eimeria mitis TaxID=44415 RepID=U6JXF5_9EIME|nr:SAG family member [Eimeria mitis]CDJ29416.1 SAG family member [Eimeria mitis]